MDEKKRNVCINVCNSKSKQSMLQERKEKREGRLKNCGNTASKPSDRQRIKSVWNETTVHASLFFLMAKLLLYFSFVLFSLECIFFVPFKYRFFFFFTIKKLNFKTMCNICFNEQNRKDRRKEEEEEERMSMLEKNNT